MFFLLNWRENLPWLVFDSMVGLDLNLGNENRPFLEVGCGGAVQLDRVPNAVVMVPVQLGRSVCNSYSIKLDLSQYGMVLIFFVLR